MSFDAILTMANNQLAAPARKFLSPASIQGLGARLAPLSAADAPTVYDAGNVDVRPVARRLFDNYGGAVPWAQCMAAAQNALAQFNQVLGGNPAFSGPQSWEDVTMGRPGAGPQSYSRGIPQPMGLGSGNCAPGASLTLTVTAAKPMTADRMVLTGTVTNNTQLAHLFVTRVDIGGNTFLNGSNRVPLEMFRNVDALKNFSGTVIQTSQVINVDFFNAGADPSLVSGAIFGFAGTP